MSLYNRIKPSVIVTVEDCNGLTLNKLTYPKTYANITDIDALYSEETFLKLYFKLRFLEEEVQFSDNEKEIIIDDLIEVYMNGQLNLALGYFERIVNKPFDYNGSLSYNVRRLQDSEKR